MMIFWGCIMRKGLTYSLGCLTESLGRIFRQTQMKI
jgi:hypothetical protein